MVTKPIDYETLWCAEPPQDQPEEQSGICPYTQQQCQAWDSKDGCQAVHGCILMATE